MRGEKFQFYFPAEALYAAAFAMAGALLYGLFDLPYTGLKNGALLFLPGGTHAAAGGLLFIMVPFMLLLSMRMFTCGELELWVGMVIVAFMIVATALFVWARYDYVAVYPDRIVVRTPEALRAYGYDDITGLELSFVSSGGSRSRSHTLVYGIVLRSQVKDRESEEINLARGESWRFRTGTGEKLKIVEQLHPRIARGVEVVRGTIDPDCVKSLSSELKGDAQLRAIGWVD